MAQFRTWLKNQEDRNDAIGRLAAAANRDQEFPRANKLNVIVDYLKSKGANDKLLDTVENAYAEFESMPGRKSRKPTPAETKKQEVPAKARAPKPVAVQPAPAPKPRKTQEPGARAKAPAPEAKTANKKARAPKEINKPVKNAAEAEVSKPERQTARQEPVLKAAPERKPRKRIPAQPQNQAPESRTRQRPPETGLSQLPYRLLPLQRQLADAGAVLDAQFGKGYSAKNPGQVLDFARMLLTAEQNRMLHFTFADLAEALHRVASRLDSVMRQPF